MGKGKKLKRLKPNTPVGKAMGLVLPDKVDEVFKDEQAVRRDDVEGVHDMRVATKRLREAARLFRPAFGKRRMGRHLGHLEQLNDSLGAVRELDVLRLQLQDVATRNSGLAEGLQPLITRLATEREAADARLVAVLDETLPHLKQDFKELLGDRAQKRKDVWKMPFVALGCESVTERVLRAFELEQAARVPGAVADLHKMRIAIKKVKYALELFLDVLGKPAKKAYKPISKLQDLMGKVHDCDVLLRVLEEAKGETLSAGVADKATKLVAADRARLHEQTMALLDEMHDKKLPKRLLAACKLK